jgi:hypothetical protein
VGIVLATAMMYLRIDVIVAMFNAQLALILLPALGSLFAMAPLRSRCGSGCAARATAAGGSATKRSHRSIRCSWALR